MPAQPTISNFTGRVREGSTLGYFPTVLINNGLLYGDAIQIITSTRLEVVPTDWEQPVYKHIGDTFFYKNTNHKLLNRRILL